MRESPGEPESGDPGVSPPGLAPADAALLRRLVPAMPTAWHRLNPLTKATIAVGESIAAFLLGGYLGPLLVLALLIVPSAAVARVTGRLLRVAIVVALPISISVVLVSVFTRAGSTVLFAIGPLTATLEGADFAGQVLVRLLVLAAALGLFGLTTEPRALVFDLERRGVSPRVGFAAAATLETIPAMAERATAIQAAQRARGLDTEGGLRARLRGVLPLVVPVVLSSLTEVEERSLALEARAFGRPGRRHLLWTLPDAAWERPVRWAIVLGVLAVGVARLVGAWPRLP
jgi:energy-coupling factor transport system permease protein